MRAHAWAVCLVSTVGLVVAPYRVEIPERPAREISIEAAPGPVEPMEQAVLERINAIRREHGLAPLRPDPDLSRAAREYSCRMADDGFFSHTGPAGSRLADRIRAAGKEYEVVGENLARNVNAADPVAVAVEGWMRSEGHRANILRPAFTETGVGICARPPAYDFTQIFLRPRSS